MSVRYWGKCQSDTGVSRKSDGLGYQQCQSGVSGHGDDGGLRAVNRQSDIGVSG